MKRNYFLGIITGLVLGIGISVGASTILTASNVSYAREGSTSTNAQEALDELYTEMNAGSATSEKILEGETAVASGEMLTGTMKDYSSWTVTPTESGHITIPKGYHDGTGYVDTSSIFASGVASGGASNIRVVGQAGSSANFATTISMTTPEDIEIGFLEVLGHTYPSRIPYLQSMSTGTSSLISSFVSAYDNNSGMGAASSYVYMVKNVKSGTSITVGASGNTLTLKAILYKVE